MKQQAPVRRPSRALLRFFDLYLWLYFRRHFHAVRLAHAERWPRTAHPLVICLNHPSWWDPLTALVLSRFLARRQTHYAPMDANEFARYGVLGKLGLFPVEQGSARGAAQFLRGAAHVFSQPNATLWMTPQGAFTDVRTRPLQFRAGLDALLARHGNITVLPLALEYTFWDERLPEALALLGEPVEICNNKGADIETALAAAQDELAALAALRDPAAFTPVMHGHAGVAGVYGLWQRLAARLGGKPFVPQHGRVYRNRIPGRLPDQG